MVDYAKKSIVCWFCGYPTMKHRDELGEGWRECSRCGATSQDKPSSGKRIATIIIEGAAANGKTKYRPSHSVVREVKKMREGKK